MRAESGAVLDGIRCEITLNAPPRLAFNVRGLQAATEMTSRVSGGGSGGGDGAAAAACARWFGRRISIWVMILPQTHRMYHYRRVSFTIDDFNVTFLKICPRSHRRRRVHYSAASINCMVMTTIFQTAPRRFLFAVRIDYRTSARVYFISSKIVNQNALSGTLTHAFRREILRHAHGFVPRQSTIQISEVGGVWRRFLTVAASVGCVERVFSLLKRFTTCKRR